MRDSTAAWHDVECASYRADLALWRELATERGGPILEIGAGTGRVALDLASAGHEVTALEADSELARALAGRARARGVRIDCVTGDARSFELGQRFSLVLAPMQVVQLLGGAPGRRAMLACVRRHLRPGGLLAAALADPFDGRPEEAEPPLPDVREQDGWVLSSTPVAVRREPGAVAVDRLRQAVSPAGALTESVATVLLDELDPAQLEGEGVGAGLHTLERRVVPPTPEHVGSTVVLLEAGP